MDPKSYGVYVDNIVIGIQSGKTAVIDKMMKMNIKPNNYDIDQIMIDIKKYFETNSNISNDDFINIVNLNKYKRLVKNKRKK